MRIKTTRWISPENIGLAIVDNAKVYSNEAIEINRYTGNYLENTVPIFTEYVRTHTKVYELAASNAQRSIYKTDIYLLSDDFMITNEVIFDRKNLQTIPLWYVYELRGYYINRSTTKKVITRSLRGDVINNLVVENSNEIPVVDVTFEIRPIDPDGNILDLISQTAYRVDVNNNRIVITNPNTLLLYPEYDFQIQMRTVVPEISLSYADGSAVPKNLYRFQFQAYTSDLTDIRKDVYTARVLVSDIADSSLLQVEYEQYQDIQNNALSTRLVTEIANPRRLFLRTDGTKEQAKTLLSENPYAYVLDGGIYSVISTKEDFFLKYSNITGEKITVKKPLGLTIEYPWYLEMVPNVFTRGGLTYDMVERNLYTFRDNLRIAPITEEVARISATMLKVHNRNLFVRYEFDGTIVGLDLYVDGIKRNSIIDDIDARNGVILLNKSVGLNQRVTCTYSYYTETIPYSVNMNPSSRFPNETKIIEKIMLMYMLPKEELKADATRSVFHLYVYKYPGIYANLAPYEVSIEAAEAFVTGLDEAGRSNLYSLIPEYINGTAGNVLHPILLGAVTVNPTKTEESTRLIDIRQRGGGIIEDRELEASNWNTIRHFMDIGRWDGLKLNVGNVIVIDIPTSVLTLVRNRLRLFDLDILRDPTNTDLLEQKTLAAVEDAVKKYTPVTKHVEIQYYED